MANMEMEECVVCLAPLLPNPATTACGHTFHREPCLRELLGQPSPRCPICRADLPRHLPSVNVVLRDALAKVNACGGGESGQRVVSIPSALPPTMPVRGAVGTALGSLLADMEARVASVAQQVPARNLRGVGDEQTPLLIAEVDPAPTAPPPPAEPAQKRLGLHFADTTAPRNETEFRFEFWLFICGVLGAGVEFMFACFFLANKEHYPGPLSLAVAEISCIVCYVLCVSVGLLHLLGYIPSSFFAVSQFCVFGLFNYVHCIPAWVQWDQCKHSSTYQCRIIGGLAIFSLFPFCFFLLAAFPVSRNSLLDEELADPMDHRANLPPGVSVHRREGETRVYYVVNGKAQWERP